MTTKLTNPTKDIKQELDKELRTCKKLGGPPSLPLFLNILTTNLNIELKPKLPIN